MTEPVENPTFIRGDFTPVAKRIELALSGARAIYEPELDADQMDELIKERAQIFSEAPQSPYAVLQEVISPEAMVEKAKIFRLINSECFFDTQEISFIINPLRPNNPSVLNKFSDSELVDSIIEKMCSAMKAVGINNQTISMVRATIKMSIENSLTNDDDVPPIPNVAPRKYRGVIQDGPPVDFIRSVYTKWIIAEVLDREALDKLDHNLVLAVYSYKKRNPNAPTLKDVLASKSAADANRLKVYSQTQNLNLTH